MKIIIAGSRQATRKQTWSAIANSPFHLKISQVVSGHHDKGADLYGELWAEYNSLPIKMFPADWDNLDAKPCKIKYRGDVPYNALAGFQRNQQMADYADGLILVRYHKSPGSTDMLERAIRNNLYLYVWEVF